MTMKSALDRYYDSGKAEGEAKGEAKERAKSFEIDKARVQNLRNKGYDDDAIMDVLIISMEQLKELENSLSKNSL